MSSCASDVDEKIRMFGKYFRKFAWDTRYCTRWPKSYAGGCPNTNMSLENFHSDLKMNWFHRFGNYRLDEVVEVLVQKTKKDLVDRFIKVAKNPATNRYREMRPRHDKGMLIPRSDIVATAAPNCWHVKSASVADQWYEVRQLQNCAIPLCVRCCKCGVCHHMMECSCADNSRLHVCKHIHAICIQFDIRGGSPKGTAIMIFRSWRPSTPIKSETI